MDSKMEPSETYSRDEGARGSLDTIDSPSECGPTYQLEEWEVQEIFDEESIDIASRTHYYVNINGSDRENYSQTEDDGSGE